MESVSSTYRSHTVLVSENPTFTKDHRQRSRVSPCPFLPPYFLVPRWYTYGPRTEIYVTLHPLSPHLLRRPHRPYCPRPPALDPLDTHCPFLSRVVAGTLIPRRQGICSSVLHPVRPSGVPLSPSGQFKDHRGQGLPTQRLCLGCKSKLLSRAETSVWDPISTPVPYSSDTGLYTRTSSSLVPVPCPSPSFSKFLCPSQKHTIWTTSPFPLDTSPEQCTDL